MRSLYNVLLVLVNVHVMITTSSQSAIYVVEYCRNNVSAYETYTNISRAECALRCLNYTGCFGVSMTDLTESSGIVATCQLEPFRSVNFGQLCQYNAGSLNYYRTDECARCGFTKYGSKCYKSVTTVTDIPSKIDAECRRKYNGSRAVLPRTQEDLDETFGYLKFIQRETHRIAVDYKEVNGHMYIRDGPVLNFTYTWYKDEPNQRSETCVLLINFEFADVHCTRHFHYICVKDHC